MKRLLCLLPLALLACAPQVEKAAPAPPPPTPLEAVVSFDGFQFTIEHRGELNWKDVTMTLNDVFSSPVEVLEAGHTYTVGAGQFADSRGERFDPLQMKALRFKLEATFGLSERGEFTHTF